MNITLTPELTKLVEEQVATGKFQTALEVIASALVQQRESAKWEDALLEANKGDIEAGIQEVKKGEQVDGRDAMAEILTDLQDAQGQKGK